MKILRSLGRRSSDQAELDADFFVLPKWHIGTHYFLKSSPFNYTIMKKNFFKNAILLVAFAATLGAMTSCNRGYGCPTNFSAGDVVSTLTKVITHQVYHR